MHIIQKHCADAQQTVRGVENAEACSKELKSQLDRAQQASHSQQLFVHSLEVAISQADQGKALKWDAKFVWLLVLSLLMY